jgi:LmbE family N-acetylglucosaminyl deacetylase
MLPLAESAPTPAVAAHTTGRRRELDDTDIVPDENVRGVKFTTSAGPTRSVADRPAASPLTLMAVHAHPDDESTSTGGILAHYALRGVRTIVVTCTDGDLGDGPGGVKPGKDGHDPHEVAAIRQGELRRACELLAVSDLELLAYHDSGMAEWGLQHRENAFCSVPIEHVGSQIAQLIECYQPQVVVTYDPHSTRHPDHVHAARATTYAVNAGHVVAKLYYKAHGSSYWQRLNRALAEVGIQRAVPSGETLRILEYVEQRITTAVDVRQVVDRKRTALHAHASQIGSSLAGKLPASQFRYAFGTETYIRARDTTGAATPEDDLFTGL